MSTTPTSDFPYLAPLDYNAEVLAQALADDDTSALAGLVAFWHEQASWWHGRADALADEVAFLRGLVRVGNGDGDDPGPTASPAKLPPAEGSISASATNPATLATPDRPGP